MLIIADSPRRCDLGVAQQIVQELGDRVETCVVIVSENARQIADLVDEIGCSMVQVHGSLTANDYMTIKTLTGCAIIQSVPVSSSKDIENAPTAGADLMLFDTKVPGLHGGTGRSFDWSWLKGYRGQAPVILSGGLTPLNLQIATSQATAALADRFFAADVASGVESAIGVKSHSKIASFISNSLIDR